MIDSGVTKYNGNWVDRGDPRETPLARVLGFALKRETEERRFSEQLRDAILRAPEE